MVIGKFSVRAGRVKDDAPTANASLQEKFLTDMNSANSSDDSTPGQKEKPMAVKTKRRCQDIGSKRAVLSTLVTQSEKCIYTEAGRSVHNVEHSPSKDKISGMRTSTDREAFWNFAAHKLGAQHELAEVHMRNLAYGEREDTVIQ